DSYNPAVETVQSLNYLCVSLQLENFVSVAGIFRLGKVDVAVTSVPETTRIGTLTPGLISFHQKHRELPEYHVMSNQSRGGLRWFCYSRLLRPFPGIRMTCRDRTLEFQSACKSLQGRPQNGVQPSKPALSALRQRSDFTVMAKRIGKDLSNTFAKLEKLTILAKRKSLFDDKAVEIEELTYIIRQDINSLNKQIAQLQDLVRSRAAPGGRHIQTHSKTIVVSLQSKLASISNDFKSVLEVRTEPPASSSPLMANNFKSSVLMQDESRSLGDVAIDMDSQSNPLQLQLIDEQDSYIQSRSDTMQNIESTIVELGSIFQQLAHMVKEQEETIQRIDANVEDTQLNVDGAHTEILKYFQSVSSNRWLMIKIFLVLVVFFIIFVVFFA
ncbi:Syntaxin-5, partial [Dissostichus eleginoides]